MVTNEFQAETTFEQDKLEQGDGSSNWLNTALNRVNDADLLNYARWSSAQGETLSRQLEEQGYLPKVAMEFVTRHHNDLDLDGNGFISEKEMTHVLDSPELSKNLDAVERNSVNFLKENWKVAAKSSNDEWFSERKGISIRDAQNLDRIDKRKLVHSPTNLRTDDLTNLHMSLKPGKLGLRTMAGVNAMGMGTAFDAGMIRSASSSLGFGTTLDAIGSKYKHLEELPANYMERALKNGSSSPLVVSEFLSKRFSDFDLNGNKFLSDEELNKIQSSKLWSRSLSSKEFQVIGEAQRYGRTIKEAHNDELLWEKSGMSEEDVVAFGLTHVKNVDEMPKVPGDYLKMAQVGDDPRQYLIHIPESYDPAKKVPLVIFLHPFMGSADEAAKMTEFNKKADEEGFIAIYPNGRFCKASGIRAWNVTDFPNFVSSDTDFVNTIIETAKEGLSVDPSKVFVAGYSNGGMLAQDIGTKFSDKVAAVACVSGCMTGLEKGPSEDVSVLMIHGTNDKIVPYDGRLKWLNKVGLPAMRSVDYARDFWTKNDQLTQVEKQTVKEGVELERWTNPDKKTELQIYSIDQGKHHYPGGDYQDVPDNPRADAIEATNVIWDFFESHAKNAQPATLNA